MLNGKSPKTESKLHIISSESSTSLSQQSTDYEPPNSNNVVPNGVGENAAVRIDEEGQNLVTESNTMRKLIAIRLVDHLLNLFIFTPLIVSHWASSWDLIYLYLFPKNTYISYGITFVGANLILFASYCLQNHLQAFHDSYNVHYRRRSTNYYYNKRFFIRCVYTYVLTWAYVAQWRTYWDVYNLLTSKIRFEYFLGISLVTLILYRYLLRCSYGSLVQMVPYRLQPDLKFNEYFIQAKVKIIKYKWLENITSFIYYEFIEMIISVFIWKGVWDLLDTGVDQIFDNNKVHSIMFTLVLGYSIYLGLMLVERLLRSLSSFNSLNKPQLRSLTEDVLYLVAYFSMVATWRSFWSGFDQLCLVDETPHRVYLIVGAHFLTFIVLFALKLGSSVYGPAGASNEPADTSSTSGFNHFKLFDIRYFFSWQQRIR